MNDIKVGDSVMVGSRCWDDGESAQVVKVSQEAITVAVGCAVLNFDPDTLRSSDERWGPSIWIDNQSPDEI